MRKVIRPQFEHLSAGGGRGLYLLLGLTQIYRCHWNG
jgi:hypothetical protein